MKTAHPNEQGAIALWWRRANRPEPPSRVIGMVLICFASATIQVIGIVFPGSLRDPDAHVRGALITAFDGLLYLSIIRWFRVWMLHAIVVIGFTTGFLALAQTEDPTKAALTISTLLWTCVFVGATYDPGTSRAYAAFVVAGMGIALLASGVTGGVGLWAAFSVSFAVTMEILSRMSSRLRSEAVTDSLTGLLNRKGLERHAAAALAEARRSGRPLALVHLDLDGFKQINDSFGHLEGDRRLVSAALAWRGRVRLPDVVARVGGDEFVLLAHDAGRTEAEVLLERLRAVSPLPFSAGIAVFEEGDDLESCLARADLELYARKARRPSEQG